MSGPPPDPNALRRNRLDDRATWTVLPATGRDGEPPEWPFEEISPRQAELWAELWSRPQATAWEAMGADHEVALYVRALASLERPEPPRDAQRVVRQCADSLGLSVQGMMRNRWKIAAAEQSLELAAVAGEQPGMVRADGSPRVPTRERLKVVRRDDGG